MLKKVLTSALGIILVIFGLVVSAVMMPLGYVHWEPLATLEKALKPTADGSPEASSVQQGAPEEATPAVVASDGMTEKIDFLLTDPAENPRWWGEAAQKGLSAGDLPKVLLGWKSSGGSGTSHVQGGGLLTSSLTAPSSLASSAAYAALSAADDEGGASGYGPQAPMDPLNNAIPFYSEPTVTTPTSPTPAVPEPSTLSLMSLVGIGLVLLSRCRRIING